MKELDNYQQWQQNKYGDILQAIQVMPDGELFETGVDELNRMTEWIEMQAEQQLIESEKMHDW